MDLDSDVGNLIPSAIVLGGEAFSGGGRCLGQEGGTLTNRLLSL